MPRLVPAASSSISRIHGSAISASSRRTGRRCTRPSNSSTATCEQPSPSMSTSAMPDPTWNKPAWRVKAYAGQPLSDRDLEEARSWGERLQVPDYKRLIELLGHAPFGKEQKADLQRWSSLYALKLEEGAGLDVVYDGEQQRTEMYDWAVSHSNGFERRGSVRAFDNKYYTKAAVTGPISLKTPFHNGEFSYLVSVAEAELKIPITGAYTIADWSFDRRNDDNIDRR